MSVCKLGGIAFRFAGDGLDAKLINLSGGSRGQYHSEAQACKEGEPERIVFIYVQDSRNADLSSASFFLFQRRIAEVSLKLIIKEIRKLIFGFFFSEAAFTAVAGNKTSSAAEMIDRETAAVGTALALGHGGLVF